MKKLDFNIPFSGFTTLDFLNCFSSTYLFLEKFDYTRTGRKPCGISNCEACGYCREDGSVFFLFDTMCGRSALRLRYDGEPTEMQKWIGDTKEGNCGTDDTINFLFGFAGYAYRKVTGDFRNEIIASINADKPVIAKVKTGAGRFRVIIGHDKNKLLEPDYKGAQKAPKKAVKYDELEALYIIGDKIAPRYFLKDGLERIVQVMEYNASEKLWEGYFEKIGMYTADSFGKCGRAEKLARLKRVAETMEHTWNCHNFAEVFRKYREDGDASLYDAIGDMKKLRNPAMAELFDRISGPCFGYTHDLAWALVGLSEGAEKIGYALNMGYPGEMAELTLCQIKKNDEGVLECVKRMLEILEETE